MNVSFVGLSDFRWSTKKDVASLQLGDHDPLVRGFTIPNAELALDGAVDPYFKAPPTSSTSWTRKGKRESSWKRCSSHGSSLPANLQLKVGQFLAEFGRHNPQHPHSWAFADQPLVINRMFGPDGLRGQGARLAWLPTPGTRRPCSPCRTVLARRRSAFARRNRKKSTASLLSAPSMPGRSALRSSPHCVGELTSNELCSGAYPAGLVRITPADTRTQIYGADIYWKWKSPRPTRLSFVSFQSEVMTRRFVDRRISFEEPLLTTWRRRCATACTICAAVVGVKPLIVPELRGEFVDSRSAAFVSDLRLIVTVSPLI